MQHIDIYMFKTFLQKKYPTITDEIIQKMVREHYGISFGIIELENFMRAKPPKTGQIVHWMFGEGYSPTYISSNLEINASSVSYHLKKDNLPEYINVWFHAYVKHQQILLQEREEKILGIHSDIM